MNVLILDEKAVFYARALAQEAPALRFTPATSEAEALDAAPEAQVLIALAPRITPALLEAAPRLEWVQALTTGVDNLMHLEAVALTNAGGFHGPQMSELAVLLTLSVLRRFPAVLAAQRAHEWDRRPQPILQGKTACLVGVGAIAEHLAPILAAFGMEVIGVSGRGAVPGFARIYPRAELHAALGAADVTVLLTPLTPQTRHIIDAAALAAMKPGAVLVNIARGGCVDEAALLAALQSGQLAGAGCDVFAEEPLGPQSPLWEAPNLIITPHIGGYADCYAEQALPIVAAQVRRYAAGGVEALQERIL